MDATPPLNVESLADEPLHVGGALVSIFNLSYTDILQQLALIAEFVSLFLFSSNHFVECLVFV